MKQATLMLAFSLVLNAASCSPGINSQTGNPPPLTDNGENSTDTGSNDAMHIELIAGSQIFTVRLEDNDPAKAFKKLLPITLNMSDLNGNEKYYRLPADLPADPVNPGTIHNGDLMLFGSNSLVIFYKTFPTSYRYTRVGSVSDPSGLETALGPGNVTVTFRVVKSPE